MNRPPTPLLERRVLVVEDQFLIAQEMRRAVRSLGGEVVGPANSLNDAMTILKRETIDLAVLDINLGDHMVFPVAEELVRLEVPFIFATGYETWVVPDHLKGAPHLQKPVTVRALADAVARLKG